MKTIEYDMSQIGLRAVIKDWQEKALSVVWETSEGINSRMVYEKVNKLLGSESISRASVINFLEDMREMGVLRGEERTGKGGHHWVYFPGMDEAGFKKFIAEKLISSMLASFPEETEKAIRSI